MRGDAIITVPWGRHMQHRERRMLFAMRIIEHTEDHYEVQDVKYGKVYRWCAQRALRSSANVVGRGQHTPDLRSSDHQSPASVIRTIPLV